MSVLGNSQSLVKIGAALEKIQPLIAINRFEEARIMISFYKKIAELAKKSLSPNGKLYFEINQYLGKEMIEILEKMNFKNIELRKDIYGNDRMIKADFS